MATTETVYNGRDNTNDLLLLADGSAQDLGPVTRMVLSERSGLFSIDSQSAPAAFDWSTGTTGKVILSLGDQAIAAGTHVCRLIVYDPTNPDGIVWGQVLLKVVD